MSSGQRVRVLRSGQGSNEKDTDVLFAQLKLALTWDRSDVAEEKIFNKDISWPDGWTTARFSSPLDCNGVTGVGWFSGKLDSLMTQALTEDRVQFVRLLLNNGVVMQNFLNAKILRELYNSVRPRHLIAASCCHLLVSDK